MNKDYVIALVALLVGLAIGSIFMAWGDNKDMAKMREQQKKELREVREKESKKRDSLNVYLHDLKQRSIQDSIVIVSLKDHIKADGVQVAKLKDKLNKLTIDEKVIWITNRYSTKPK